MILVIYAQRVWKEATTNKHACQYKINGNDLKLSSFPITVTITITITIPISVTIKIILF